MALDQEYQRERVKDELKLLSLELSRSARAFGSKESLWHAEIGRMLNMIKGHCHTLERLKGRKNKDKPLLSIAIFGTYGSGKTSLLNTFSQEVNEDGEQEASTPAYALPVIEPNVLNSKDNFLYTFLAAALEEDRKNSDKGDEYLNASQILTPVQKIFQELSEDLRVLDDSHHSPEYDPVGISLETLDRHSSGLRLKETMSRFIDELAGNLSGKPDNGVVIMPVDDADMSLKELISTLDTVRRYMQHPRLVPIFTFTGRLAEELVRVHFDEKLKIGGESGQDRKLYEAATPLEITENLALQYLGKLFPVRNRIRLGHAAARVQGAQYHSLKRSGEAPDEEEVMALLENASSLLFGYSEWPIVPIVRSPLRASTLRRQIQIVDVLHATKIPLLFRNFKDPSEGAEARRGEKKKTMPSWAKTFDNATWAMLNIHRDVLKEYDLNLDDLYSWTRQSLRNVVLTGILSQKMEVRQKLIRHWRYGNEDRRSQMISLLAANIFRPRMHDEEPSGDEPRHIRAQLESKKSDQTGWREQEDIPKRIRTFREHAEQRTFSTRKGTVWFINLWMGFYLPQIMVRNRRLQTRQSKNTPTAVVGSITGGGWSLLTGPVQAMREALNNYEVYSTGIMMLREKSFSIATYNPEHLARECIETSSSTGLDLHVIVNKRLDQTQKYEKSLPELENVMEKGTEKVTDSGSEKTIEKTTERVIEKGIKPIEDQAVKTDLERPFKTSDFKKREPSEVAKKLNKNHPFNEPQTILLLHIWCFFGYEKGKPWAAISFWRGLGLLGRLLKVDMELRELRKFRETEGQRLERRDHIRRLLVSYCQQSCVVGNQAVDGGSLEKPKAQDVAFTPFDLRSNPRLEKQLDVLVDGLMEWLDEFDPETKRIDPIYPARMMEIERDAIKEKAVTRALHSIDDEEGLIKQYARQVQTLDMGRKPGESEFFKSIQLILGTKRILFQDTESSTFKLTNLVNHTKRILEKILEQQTKKTKELMAKDTPNWDDAVSEGIMNFAQLKEKLDKDSSLSIEVTGSWDKLFRESSLILESITGLHKRQERLLDQILQQKMPLGEDSELSEKISSMAQDTLEERKKIYKLRMQVLDWESCYTRRIHGETVLGSFWKNIESAYFEKYLHEWNAHDILYHWLRVLMDFFNCGRKYKEKTSGPDGSENQFTSLESTKREPKVITLLASCPFVAPFAREEGDDTIKRPVFLDDQWGDQAKRVFKTLGVGDINFFEDFKVKSEKD